MELENLKGLVCTDQIERIENKSDSRISRARVYFKNGHDLSIITGDGTYGGDEGLFEIMPSDEVFFDAEDDGDTVLGHLTGDRVNYYINKIGSAAKA